MSVSFVRSSLGNRQQDCPGFAVGTGLVAVRKERSVVKISRYMGYCQPWVESDLARQQAHDATERRLRQIARPVRNERARGPAMGAVTEQDEGWRTTVTVSALRKVDQ